MTMLNLQDLARERPVPTQPKRARKRVALMRYIVPGVVLIGFVGLLGWAARDRLIPRTSVTVVPVVMARAESQQAGTPLFQAAGWVEPRPAPILVAALTEGIVEELLVVEGQAVKAGEPVARLSDVNAKLVLRQAEAALAIRESECESAKAERTAAKLRLENPVHLNAALAEADSLLARTETELAKLPYQIESAQARLDYAERNLEGKRQAGDAIAGRLIHQAESEQLAAHADLTELNQREPLLKREAEALQKRVTALATQRELLIDESRQQADSEAKLKGAQARADEARLGVEVATLALERTVVRAPSSGRVLEVMAGPGARVMGLEMTSGPSSSTVVALYDPEMLQVRADVRLEDVGLVQPGQPVEIEIASSKEPLRGVVLTPTSVANIQKNTLEVKVAIEHPPSTTRPEMLVTATFLAPQQPAADQDKSQERERLLVPRQLVELTDGENMLWIVDASGVARKRSVQLGQACIGELVEVSVGLAPTDKLISGNREALSDGDRVTIVSEDAALGMATSTR